MRQIFFMTNPMSNFENLAFETFKNLLSHFHNELLLSLCLDLIEHQEFFGFKIIKQICFVHT
jgi:hypothetical protein